MSRVTDDEVVHCKYHLVPMNQDYLNSIKLTISVQKLGRHDLTIIVGLDNKEFDLKSICSKLKKFCGSGGSVKEDQKVGHVVYVQGDVRIKVRSWLAEKLLINEMNIIIMGA